MGKAAHLLNLPSEVFELIVQHATQASQGCVPFENWHLTQVCTKFQITIRSLISNVDLVTAYDQPKNVDLALILQGPLPKCRRLKHLNIAGCDSLTDNQVGKFLRICPPLKSFTAVICMHQTDVIVDDLSMRAAGVLERLHLAGCDRFRHGALFPRHRQTEAIPFHPCEALSDVSLLHVAERCNNLRCITLSKALSITDHGLRALGTLPRLEEVVLRRLTGITNEGISYLADGNGDIKSFQLLSCGTISDSGLMAMAHGRATRHLEMVAVSFNHGVTERGVRELATNLPMLRDLQCDHCASLKETWCKNVYENVSPLKRLSFRGVDLQITKQGIQDLTRIAQLEALNLAYVGTVNAEILQLLKLRAPKLTTLVLEACSKVDDQAADVLATFSTLTTLDISWCSSLTSSGIRAIATGRLGRTVQRLSLGPVNGNEREGVLFTVGSKCVRLQQLVLCGEVDYDVFEWLKTHCKAEIECAQVAKRRRHDSPRIDVVVSEMAALVGDTQFPLL